MKLHSRWLQRECSFGIVLLIVMCLAGGAMADPPATINIRGQLLDAQGHALPGLRDFSVQFFDAGTGGAALGSAITGQTEVSLEGLFNIPVTLPPQVMLSPQAWYEVAVASGAEPAPLTGADLFPNRIKMESVPFSLESAEAAHVDVSAIGSGTVLESEFEYLSGVTGNIQGQLDAKANSADVYTKTQEDAAHAIKANAADVYTKMQEDAAHGLKANASDVYTKDDVDDSQAAQDLEIAAKANAADVYTKGDVDTMQGVQDTEIAGKVAKAGDTMTGALNVNNSYVGVGQAAAPAAPADKLYNVAGTLYWNGQQVIAGGTAGFPWTAVTANTQMAANNGYIANSASLITLTLPLSANINFGDIIRVTGMGAGGWKIAQNASQRILTGPMQIPDYSGAWTARAMVNDWIAIASSADGRVLVAAEYGGSGGGLYTSWDGGVTWVNRALNQWWYGLACSADGTKMVGVTGGYIYTSYNSGATWTQRGTNQNWGACAASADGTRMAALGDTDLYVSTDWGATWVSKDTALNGWRKVAMSADGMKIACCTNIAATNYIRLSVDGGETFSNRNGLTGTYYADVAMSADGTKIAACAYGGQIWTSTDTGATWTAHESVRNWRAIAMSADGAKLMAHDLNGYVYFSTDSGLTWTSGGIARNIVDHGLVMSADGTKAAFGQWGGQIYTLSTSGTVTSTVTGTAGYISGTADTAVELQYQGSDTFRVLSYESGTPDSSSVWKLDGNAGTIPGAHFVGTSDNAALEFKVNNARAFRLEPNSTSPNVIGGHSGNWVLSGKYGATIAGGSSNSVTGDYGTIGGGSSNTVTQWISTVAGGQNNQATGDTAVVSGGRDNTASAPIATVGGGYTNTAAGNSSTISGGHSNTANGDYSTVSGGKNNTASGIDSTVAGGDSNTASGGNSTVAGGYHNTASVEGSTVGGGRANTASGYGATVAGGTGNRASGSYATVAGGYGNMASGYISTVGGGYSNLADGDYSFAGGFRAIAESGGDGSFVWADSTNADFICSTANAFWVRASGGARFYSNAGLTAGVNLAAGGGSWTNLSDRNAKENFTPVDSSEVLDKVIALPISTWNYKAQDASIRHIGPMAQDVYAAFAVGESDTGITTIDADGVALAAIQGLNQKVEEQKATIQTLESRIAKLEALVEQLAAK